MLTEVLMSSFVCVGSNNEFISNLFGANISVTGSLALQPERYGIKKPFIDGSTIEKICLRYGNLF